MSRRADVSIRERTSSVGEAIGIFSMRKATGERASSFMCGRNRQLCHQSNGELRTLRR